LDLFSKDNLLQVSAILFLTLLVGVFYNISNPNRIQFIGDEKIVDYSQSDSLLNALRIQDSILKAADSLKKLSNLREDSLKLLNEKRIQDSILAQHKQDSLKRIQDSLASLNKADSVKQVQDYVKPVDIRIDFAKALYDKNYRFIDARDVADFQAGHIKGAMNVPFHDFEKYRDVLEGLPKDQVYVTYCSSACDVSIDMAYAMAKMGFKKLYIFHGGWDEWKAAGYPTE
jgi:rhodanese-related sulfurtransferase